MRLSLLPVLLRETFSSNAFPREPEPDLVMEGPAQVAAFAQAGRIDGVLAATYLFNSARISQVIQGCRAVLDLGCGPATQLGQVAQLNPEVSFTGVDLSPGMLDDAKDHTEELRIKNVRFVKDDISRLEHIPDQSADGVISTLALHHLPTPAHLQSCFRQIARVLRPGGAIYLVDLGRLKSLKSVLFFAYMNSDRLPHAFCLDYERSLRAAFVPDDFRAAAKEAFSRAVDVYSTFQLPVLILAKSGDRPLPDGLRDRLRSMRRSLPRSSRGDLDDIRLFFRLGGLTNDPFH